MCYYYLSQSYLDFFPKLFHLIYSSSEKSFEKKLLFHEYHKLN